MASAEHSEPGTEQDMYTLKLSPRLNWLRSGRRLLWCCALAAGLLLLLTGAGRLRGGATVPLDVRLPGEPRYGIILDAGSTGSRVHVFEFRYRPGRRQPYILVDELFKQTHPGLSSFAGRPHEAARSLVELVDACKQRIPRSYWARTPLALKATAGLRLLQPKTSKMILSEVRQLLSSYPFAVGDDSVEIMDGLDEGIFSWVTLNFLNGQLAQPRSSFGALDLGGGSTQVTFAMDPKFKAPQGFAKRFSMGGTRVQLYSHSYLGLGLMSARLGVLRAGDKGLRPPGDKSFTSPCLPAGYSGHWLQAGVNYSVAGAGAGGGYESCRSLAKRVVKQQVLALPPAARQRFHAFSYFYDRAADLGLISRRLGGNATLVAMETAARRTCQRPAGSPFLCLDATFIVSLLADGYGFQPDDRFVMRKKIQNVELSWALGAVFDIFYNHGNSTGAAAAGSH